MPFVYADKYDDEITNSYVASEMARNHCDAAAPGYTCTVSEAVDAWLHGIQPHMKFFPEEIDSFIEGLHIAGVYAPIEFFSEKVFSGDWAEDCS